MPLAVALLMAQLVMAPASELVVSAGAASSVNLLQSTADRHYLVQTVSWGRELTRPGGPGTPARPLRVGD